MFQVINDCERDRFLLKACHLGEKAALEQWTVDSYWTEVAQAMKSASDRRAPGQLSLELLTNLIVDCTAAIYEQHSTLPSHLFSLKTKVRKFAFAYMMKYLKERRPASRWP
jgi:hypothetical protein